MIQPAQAIGIVAPAHRRDATAAAPDSEPARIGVQHMVCSHQPQGRPGRKVYVFSFCVTLCDVIDENIIFDYNNCTKPSQLSGPQCQGRRHGVLRPTLLMPM